MGMPPNGNNANTAYLNWLRRRFTRIDHIATLSEDSVNPLQLSLLDVFVPQWVRAEPPPVSLPRELWLRYLAHGKVDEHEVPHDVRRDLLDQKLKEYAERPARHVLDVITGEQSRRLVLLGYPGAGKSMLTRYVALSLADLADQAGLGGQPGHAADRRLAPLAKYVPFVAELRTYPKHANAPSFEDVIGALAGSGCPVSVTEILQSCLSERSNALVIFDGLDEVFDRELRDQLKDQIREFAQANDGARVIVTSRVTDYDRHELDEAEFAHHTLQDLGPDEVSDFAFRFYRALYPANKPEADRLSARLLTAVRQTPAIAELAGNPLLLTSIAFLGRREEVPPSRIDALGRTVRLLAEGWDAGRHLRQKSQKSQKTGRGQIGLSLEEKLDLLRLAARRIIDSAKGQQPRNYLSSGEIKNLFSGFVAQRFKKSQGDADAVARDLLAQLRDRDYILAKFETDAYGFVHRAFLDYLAADDIRWRFSEHELSEDQVMDRFQAHWREPAWQDVLPLLAGLLRADRADRAIGMLVNASPLWYLDLDPLPRHVLLAIRCLGEVRHLGDTEAASKAIGSALTEVFETVRERSDFGLGVTVAQALERDARPVLAALPPDWDGRAWYETWYLARGQFLRGERPGPVQAAAARIYATLLGRDDAARQRLTALAEGTGLEVLREAATEELAARWPDRQTAGLLRALAAGDQPWYVRRAAVRALARYWPRDPEVRDLLRGRLLGDSAAEVRGTAARILADGWRDDGDTAAALRAIGDSDADQDVAVRVVAVRALADCCHDDEDTLPWLWQRAADGEDRRVRAVAAEVLAAGWHDAPGVLTWLRTHAIQAGESDPAVRVAAARALASGWPDRKDTVELLTEIACSPGDVQKVRGAALETLAAGWRDNKRDQDVAQLLYERATGDPDDEVRYVAVQALAAYWADAPQTVPVLEHLAFGKTSSNGAGADPGPYVRAAAAQALSGLCPGDQETAAQLKRLATCDGSWYVRQMALRAVAAGWRDDPATPGWLKERAAGDDDADVRGTAVQVLAEGWRDEETLSWLYACTTGDTGPDDAARFDKNARARRVAIREVAVGWPDQRTYAWLCERVCQDQDADVRKTALQLLAGNPEWRAAQGTVELLRDRASCDEDPEVRWAATQVTSAAWPNGRQARP